MNPQFHEIFFKKNSKKKKSEKRKEKIIIDYREKNSLVSSELIKRGLEIEFKNLDVADYVVKNTAIERKTVSDFLNSMINRRLLNQLEEIQQYENRILIIEGLDEQELYNDSCYKTEQRGINPNAIRSFLLSIILKYKTPFIFSKDAEDTAKFIFILSQKKEKESPTGIRIKKKVLNKKERLQFIIESFPGIGPKTAKKLLKKFKSIKNIINASNSELKEILGKKSELFKELIELKYI